MTALSRSLFGLESLNNEGSLDTGQTLTQLETSDAPDLLFLKIKIKQQLDTTRSWKMH